LPLPNLSEETLDALQAEAKLNRLWRQCHSSSSSPLFGVGQSSTPLGGQARRDTCGAARTRRAGNRGGRTLRRLSRAAMHRLLWKCLLRVPPALGSFMGRCLAIHP